MPSTTSKLKNWPNSKSVFFLKNNLFKKTYLLFHSNIKTILVYFESSPPWQVGCVLSGYGCHLGLFHGPKKKSNGEEKVRWKRQPAYRYFSGFLHELVYHVATQDITCQKYAIKKVATIFQNMSVYHLAETNMPKHAKTCQNMPKHAKTCHSIHAKAFQDTTCQE